jgi:hypothetical protein
VKTQQQRSEEKRQAKLDLIQEQVDAGTLVIRKMTEKERAQFPRRPTDKKRPRRS